MMRISGRKPNRFLRQASLLFAAAMLLCSCGKSDAPKTAANGGRSADITLEEPVAASIGIEKVTYRNLYKYEVLTGAIYPETTQYAFPENVTFGKYHVFPGDTVSAGTVLAEASLTGLLEEQKSLRKQIDDLTVSYSQADAVRQLQLAHEVWYIDSRSREAETNEELALDVQRSIFRRDRLEQEIENALALYELDLSYLQAKLAELQKKQAKQTIRSDRAGVVTAFSEIAAGDQIRENTAVVAISDESVKYFRCDYRSEKEMAKYLRYYLVAGGRTYEVEYIPYTSEQYSKLQAAGETVPAVFRVRDDEGTLACGMYGTLVLIEDERKGVVSVSDSALHRDTDGYYANRVTDRGSEKVYIERGMQDGNFTEVLSGLEAGDSVLLSDYLVESKGRTVLTRGDYVVPYEGQGYVYFPDLSLIKNDVAYGDVTLTELLVHEQDLVKKGDVIARISVKGDQIALEEQERRLQRLMERQEEAQKEYDHPATAFYSESKKRQMENNLASLNRQIEDAQKTVDDMKKAYRTTAFVSPVDGVVRKVTDLNDGALLQSGEWIATIGADSPCLLRVANPRGTVQYGMEFQISYIPGDKESLLTGTALSLSATGLSSGLTGDYIYVRESTGLIRDLCLNGSETEDSLHYLRLAYALYGEQEREENVVLVPMKAVTVLNGRAYVQVLEEDGNVAMQGFIPGNTGLDKLITIGDSPDSMTWAVEGLEEGMTVCWQ